MTVDTKAHFVRIILWIASIVAVAWPLQLLRTEIGNVAYVSIATIILYSSHWLGNSISKRICKARNAHDNTKSRAL